MMVLLVIITWLITSSSASTFEYDKITAEEEVSLINYCHSDPNSKWIGNRCYFFNQYVQSYDEAQYNCQFHFDLKNRKVHGKLYEPNDLSNFVSMNKIAQEMFQSRFPGFWLGINGFNYASNGKSLLDETWTPWAPTHLATLDKEKTCIMAFRTKWFHVKCSDIGWSICESIPITTLKLLHDSSKGSHNPK